MSLKSTNSHSDNLSYEHLAAIKAKNHRKKAKYCQTKQLLREIRVTDSIAKRVEKANATELKNFRLWLTMEEVSAA